MTANEQSDVLALLSRPDTFAAVPTSVERIDTHISSVFLAGNRAYKLKRAVRLPFLDFTSLESRHQACLNEVSINRRTAPDIYLGVLAVTREADGRLALDGRGEVVDWLVVMQRFDQDDLFDRMAAAGRLEADHARALADAVAALHGQAEVRPKWGGEPGIRLTIDGNAVCFAQYMPGLFHPVLAGRVTEGSLAWLTRLAPLLQARRKRGMVRRCHGDLHLGNICMFDGKPTLFDAIEFNEDFASIDVFYDLAFLLMDLRARGLPALASLVLNRYLERTGDFEGVAALPLFLSLRAAIRAHVSAAMARPQADHRQREQAQSYLGLAAGYLTPPPPRLVAVGGLSGSGKSRLARDLAPFLGGAPGAVVLRSDVLRKRLLGVEPETRLPPDAYTEEVTERTYQELYERARQVLGHGHSVIADAVFARPEQRAAIEAVARRLDLRFEGLWLEASPDAMRQRIEKRQANASDATPEVLERQLTYALGDLAWPRLDSSGSKAATLERGRKSLGL